MDIVKICKQDITNTLWKILSFRCVSCRFLGKMLNVSLNSLVLRCTIQIIHASFSGSLYTIWWAQWRGTVFCGFKMQLCAKFDEMHHLCSLHVKCNVSQMYIRLCSPLYGNSFTEYSFMPGTTICSDLVVLCVSFLFRLHHTEHFFLWFSQKFSILFATSYCIVSWT